MSPALFPCIICTYSRSACLRPPMLCVLISWAPQSLISHPGPSSSFTDLTQICFKGGKINWILGRSTWAFSPLRATQALTLVLLNSNNTWKCDGTTWRLTAGWNRLVSVAWQPRGDTSENREGPNESGEVMAPEWREPKDHWRSTNVSTDLNGFKGSDLHLWD